MAIDYETVGAFYATLGDEPARASSSSIGEKRRVLRRSACSSRAPRSTSGREPVICSKTALAAFDAIVEQGEGAPRRRRTRTTNASSPSATSSRGLKAANPAFAPAFPAAVNPVLRPPMRAGRVWIENEEAADTVDLANTAYVLMLRLICVLVPGAAAASGRRRWRRSRARPDARDDAARASAPRACRRGRRIRTATPACRSRRCATPRRCRRATSAGRFFIERLRGARWRRARRLADATATRARRRPSRVLADLAQRAARTFADRGERRCTSARARCAAAAGSSAARQPACRRAASGARRGAHRARQRRAHAAHRRRRRLHRGRDLTLIYEGKKCIHSRFCVTGAPKVFLANVKGPWIHPDAMRVERLVEIAHVCPSGAIRYQRKDGSPTRPRRRST